MMLRQGPQAVRKAAFARLPSKLVARAKNDSPKDVLKEAKKVVTGESPIADPRNGIVDQAKDSIKLRVNELRDQQLSQGSTTLQQVMNFTGPGPELINGRLAMLGFFAAMCAEIRGQETAFQQFWDVPVAVVGVSVLIIIASLIPMVRGSKVLDDGGGEGLRFGAFNVTNELLNGRSAMLGLSILLIYETATRSPLF